MKNRNKKIAILCFIFCLVVLLQINPVNAGWVSSTKGYSIGKTIVEHKKEADINKYGHYTYKFLGGDVVIDRATNNAKRNFRGTKYPKLDGTRGTLCLQHGKDSDDRASAKPDLNQHITVRDSSANIDGSTKTDTQAGRIAYIITNTSATASKGTRKNNGTQGALWLNAKAYFAVFPGKIDASFWDQVKDDDTAFYDWAHVDKAETIDKEAKEYESMLKSIVSPSVNMSRCQIKRKDNNYIIGPLRANFTDYISQTRRYAGILQDQCVLTSNGVNRAFSFCDANGNTGITVKKRSRFLYFY